MSAEDKLRELGFQLPPPPQPAGAYTPAVKSMDLIFVSGQLPLAEGQIQYAGTLGVDLDVDAGYAAARLCALNALGVLKAEVGTLEAITIVRLGGYVASTAEFCDQAKVINGASDLMAAVLGESGIHARLAVGTTSLPLGAAVELEVIAATRVV
ncbi:MAG: RidA family protein [Candidatus Latescibacterota bacterium]|nr:RidA family protein [Candidatus Latescibacterota bacterium]